MQTQNGTAAPQQQTTDLAPVQTQPKAIVRQVTPLVPTNLDEAWRLSDGLSRSSLVPPQYQGHPENVLAAFYMAQDLGVSAMQAMREIYVVKGRPTASSALKTALVRQSHLCILWECVETTRERATFRTQRQGDQKPTTLSFTIEQAKQAGLYPGKPDSAWNSYPENMLRARAASFLADLVYPDVVKGLKTPEEVEEQVEREVPGSRLFAETTAPPLPIVQEIASQIAQSQATPDEPKCDTPPVEAPKSEPGAPDPVEVLLAEIGVADTGEAIAALTKRALDICPKTHPMRAQVGDAINAAKRRVKQ